MAGTVATGTSEYCVVCCKEQPRYIVEHFAGGIFAECTGCGIHFSEVESNELENYYNQIWSEDNLGHAIYQEKVEAARDPALLEKLLATIPRLGWAKSQLGKLPRGSRVLDVGCGEGTLLWAMTNLGLEAHGCDLAGPAVTMARQLVENENYVHVGTIDNLPYEPNTFDCVVALEVLEHLPDPLRFVQTVQRLLKPGGVCLMTMPNRYRLFAVLKRALGKPHASTDYPPHHCTRWSSGALHGLLARFFEQISIGSLPYYFTGGVSRLVASSLHLLSANKMGQSLCARAVSPLDPK